LNGKEHWPQSYVNDQVRALIDQVDLLRRQVQTLTDLIADLNLKKADRRGRRPKTDSVPERLHRV